MILVQPENSNCIILFTYTGWQFLQPSTSKYHSGNLDGHFLDPIFINVGSPNGGVQRWVELYSELSTVCCYPRKQKTPLHLDCLFQTVRVDVWNSWQQVCGGISKPPCDGLSIAWSKAEQIAYLLAEKIIAFFGSVTSNCLCR